MAVCFEIHTNMRKSTLSVYCTHFER